MGVFILIVKCFSITDLLLSEAINAQIQYKYTSPSVPMIRLLAVNFNSKGFYWYESFKKHCVNKHLCDKYKFIVAEDEERDIVLEKTGTGCYIVLYWTYRTT